MSFFNKLFGGGKSDSKAPTPAEAIQRLRGVEEMLMKKQEFLEHKVEQELAIAKKNGTKNKRGDFLNYLFIMNLFLIYAYNF